MKRNNIRRTMAWISGVTALVALSACNAGELPDAGDVYLRPSFHTGSTQTRSLVNGTDATAGAGMINKVKLYVTNNSGNGVYTAPGLTGGLSEYTFGSDKNWTGSPEIKLSNIVARIYAFHPVTAAVTAGATSSDSHAISISLPAAQTFNGSNNWQCSQEDFLYGSSGSALGNTGIITASNANGSFKPAIYMQHALAQVVFKMQTTSGRPVDNIYDYVKKLTLKATSPLFMTGANGTMLLKDGTLQGLTSVKELTFTATPDNSAVKCGENGKPVVVGYGLVAPLASAPANGSVSLTVLLGKQGTSVTENERELTVTLPNPQWQKGNRYTYSITLSNRSMVVEKVNSEPIKGWDDTPGTGSLKPEGF